MSEAGVRFARAPRVGVIALLLAAAVSAAGQDIRREALVPFEDLDLLLETGTQRVLLDREAFEALRRQAQAQEKAAPPVPALLAAAAYDVRIREERAEIEGRLHVESLRAGTHLVPLPLSGVGLRSLRADGQPVPVGRMDDGSLALVVQEPGAWDMVLDAVAPVQAGAAQQVLQLQLPAPGSAHMRLTAPGDVEVHSGASVLRREYDENQNQTAFELVLPRGELRLVMSLNSRLRQQERVVVARSMLITQLTRGAEVLHARVSLDVLHRPVDRFTFAVPAAFHVTAVETPNLSAWRLLNRTEDGTPVLEVALQRETVDPVVVSITAVRERPTLAAWQFPRFAPLDVAGHVAVIGVMAEPRLTVRNLNSSGLIPIDGVLISQAAPAGVDPLRTTAGYYAPTPDFTLSASFVARPAVHDVTTHARLHIGHDGLQASGGFVVRPREEALHEIVFIAPAGWEFSAVHDEAEQALSFTVDPAEEGRQRVRIALAEPAAAGAEAAVLFEAYTTPDGWLDPWEEFTVDVPAFAVEGADRDLGAVVVTTEDDLEARPLRLQGLSPLDAANRAEFGIEETVAGLAFRYDRQPYEAALQLRRLAPVATAEAYTFHRFYRQTIQVHHELVLTLEQGRTRTVAFRLPAETPPLVAIRGLDGAGVRETIAREEAEERVWTVHLADAHAERIRLAVDYEVPAGAEGQVRLPWIRAENARYQSGLVAVEGDAELRIRVQEHPRPVDIGELAPADYEPGRRLLGAYAYVGAPSPVVLALERPRMAAMPSALVEQARVLSTVSSRAVCQSAATFSLRSRASFLALALPEDSTLWSVRCDDIPLLPQQRDGQILIDLPAPAATRPVELVVVYETRIRAFGSRGRIRIDAPRLYLPGLDDDPPVEIAMSQLHWQFHAPDGYRVVSSGGTVSPVEPAARDLAAAHVARLCFRLAGGANLDHGLISILLSPFTSQVRGVFSGMGASLGATDDANPMLQAPETMATFDEEAQAPRAEMEEQAETAGRAGQQMAQVRQRALPPAAPARYEHATRSLKIDVGTLGSRSDYVSLGAAPRLVVDLVHDRRRGAVQWAMGLAVLVGGLALLRAPRRRKLLYVVGVLLAATVLAAVPASPRWAPVWNSAFYAGCLLVPVYLAAWMLAAAARWCGNTLRRWLLPAAAAVLVLACLPPAAPAQDDTRRPVPVPDAIAVVPYDAHREGIPESDRMLVPYDAYRALWRQAHPALSAAEESPPLPYAWAGGAYRARLDTNDLLTVRGELTLRVYAREPMEIPVRLQDVLLGEARLNDDPALLRVDPDAGNMPNRQATQQEFAPAPPSTHWLLVPGPGIHRLSLEARIRLDRQGGWRIATARLPAAPATTLTLEAPAAETEVLLRGAADQARHLTHDADAVIRTVLGPDGRLDLQWRPTLAERPDEQSLTAESSAVFDIQEDHLRLLWNLDARWRGGERDAIRLTLPHNYLVETVSGDNVRGWNLDPASMELAVQFLKPVRDRTQCRVQLQAPGVGTGAEQAEVSVPAVLLPGAVRHTGRVLVRRSPLLELRLRDNRGARRLDLTAEAVQSAQTAALPVGPLGISPFQVYEFVALPYALAYRVTSPPPEIAARAQTLLRLGERERTLESRLALEIRRHPLYELAIALSPEVTIDNVIAPGAYEWDVGESEAGPRLVVRFAAGLQGDAAVVLHGRLGDDAPRTEIAIPRIEVLSASPQSGDLAIQSDPAYDVQLEDLRQLEPALLDRVRTWVNPATHQLTRAALRYTNPDVAGTARLVPRRGQVSAESVTNLRVTDRTLEQTSLLRFVILDAGVRTVEFELPEALAQARIRTPHLRQKTITPLPDSGLVQVRLDLQDAVTGELMVLIEDDRILDAGLHTIRPPIIRTGRTDARYVVLESAGRDEAVVETYPDLTPVARQSRHWTAIENLLRGGAAEAYVATPGAADPALSFRTREREVVETAGARIGLAQATLILDEHGAYRARQVYHLYNRTEPTLAVDLPQGAVLWTTRVAGELVKPLAPDPEQPRRVQIPLIRTEAGDLDYQVEMIYGGSTRALGASARTRFPLLHAANLGVDLSQVELHLPRSHHWPHFTGTLQPTAAAGDMEAGLLAYRNKTLERLTHTLKYGNAFERTRAGWNIQTLNEQQQSLTRETAAQFSRNLKISEEVRKAEALAQEVERELDSFQIEQVADESNRGFLWERYQAQDNRFSQSTLPQQIANWDATPAPGTPAPDTTQRDNFQNTDWLVSNALVSPDQIARIQAARAKADLTDLGEDMAGKRADLKQLQSQLSMLGKAAAKGQQAGEPARTPGAASRRSQEQLALEYRQQLDSQVPTIQSQVQSQPGDMFYNGAAAGDALMDRNRSAVADGRGFRELGTQIAAYAAPGSGIAGRGEFVELGAAPARPTGWVSLDAQLPEPDPQRYHTLHFASPGTADTLAGYAVSQRAIRGWQHVGLAAAATLLAWIISRSLSGRRMPPTQRVHLCNLAIITGATALLVGFLPLAALATVTIALIARRLARREESLRPHQSES